MEKSGGRPILPKHLGFWRRRIELLAKYCGLDFHPVVFEMVAEEEMSAVAAYQGFPVRYHHWPWGQEFIISKRQHKWGLGRIYELVIPTNPVYAYLVTTNNGVTHKLTMAHVFAHADFFNNNAWFRDIPADLHDRLAMNAERVDDIRREVGKEKTDQFLEACLSLSNLFDPLEPFTLQLPTKEGKEEVETEPPRLTSVDKLPPYMDRVLNPPEWVAEQRKKLEEKARLQSEIDRGLKIPAKPIRDILGFLLIHAPLEPWQQEIARIIREESVAFKGMMQTKIMNEGWAAYWHNHMLSNLGVATDAEFFSFSRLDSGVLGTGGFNPYRLGAQLWRHIKWRWDTGRHGSVWEDCKDADIQNNWEKFIVFKTLFDRFGGASEECRQAWREFATLMRETAEGRGFVRPAFFLPENYISEWLCCLDAEAVLEKLKLLPRHLLTEKFVQVEMKRCQWYISFKKKVRSGEVPIFTEKIPPNWIEWASQKEFRGKLGEGLEKMFAVRSTYNDVAFLEDFFTEDFCERHQYYTVGIDEGDQDLRYVIRSRDYRRVKKLLLGRLLNAGNPAVALYDANFNNNGELRLIHLCDGRNLDLDQNQIEEVLRRLHLVWSKRKPVHLETMVLFWEEPKSWWDTYPERPQVQPPRGKWGRYTFNGQELEADEVDFTELEEDIRRMLPYIPPNLEL